MSTLGEANRDAYRGSIDEGSAAPLMGFMDGFDAAWQSSTKVHSLLAVEQSMRTIEQEQIKKIREAGLRPPKSLDDSEDVGTGPFGGAQFRQGRYSAAAQAVIDGGGWYTDEMVAERNKELEALRKERPDLGLMTYEEIFGKVREQSQEIEKRAQGPSTTFGTIGGFIGGALGAMNPVSDPLNAAAMFVGGGTGVAGRIAVQGAAQAGVETGNMALTPNNENILLDRKPTFQEDLFRIGITAAGGAGGQALGEVATAGVRRLTTGRWFNDIPPPVDAPAPRPEAPPPHIGEVPPPMAAGRPFNDYPDFETFRTAHNLDFETSYGKTRDASLRAALDIDHVARELDRWDGPAPFEIAPPRTDVAFAREVDGVSYDRPYQRYIDNLDTVDDVARRIDPDLFRTYDKLVQQRDAIRSEIEVERIRMAEFKGADTFFDAAETQFREGDLLRRDSLQAVDQQMRDLAPLVTRAYSAAEKEWRSTPMDWNTIAFLKNLENNTGFRYRGDGQPSLTERPPKIPAKNTVPIQARTVDDIVPLARLTPDVEGKVKVNANADAVDRVRSNAADALQVIDEKVEAFVTSAAKVTKLDDGEWRAAIKGVEDKLAAQNIDEKLIASAVETYGLTTDGTKAGYVLPDGRMLDFSAGDVGRVVEHGDVYALPGMAKDGDSTFYFMEKTAALRVDFSAGVMAAAHVPTVRQVAELVRALRAERRPLYADIYDTLGEGAKSKVFERPTVDSVLDFYKSELPARPSIEKLAQELDELKYVTLPDGSRLDMLNDRVPYVDANGNETQMTVRDFLREMQKDNDALKSVVTCSRPS